MAALHGICAFALRNHIVLVCQLTEMQKHFQQLCLFHCCCFSFGLSTEKAHKINRMGFLVPLPCPPLTQALTIVWIKLTSEFFRPKCHMQHCRHTGNFQNSFPQAISPLSSVRDVTIPKGLRKCSICIMSHNFLYFLFLDHWGLCPT